VWVLYDVVICVIYLYQPHFKNVIVKNLGEAGHCWFIIRAGFCGVTVYGILIILSIPCNHGYAGAEFDSCKD
jgi:hypothetical protein